MTPERWQRINDIFLALAAAPEDQRAALLQQHCGGETELRAAVEVLLADDRRLDETATVGGERFLEPPPVLIGPGVPRAEPPDANLGRRIGPYQIKKRIGQGGMGNVYLAARVDDFKHTVAIKLIKRGMDTDEILKRFQHERQVLAALKHPHIARLLDGGSTDDGLPYFVMEYIEGQPLDEYSDEQKLNTHARLKLFQTICAAVHFAHQNTVIHRDLKPANILVADELQIANCRLQIDRVTLAGAKSAICNLKSAIPKVIDFGIAKLTNRELGFQTLDETRTEYRLMTPEYASPEQVRGQTITTASDVYSLGVVLYELLTGHRPYQLASRAKAEIERVVCEQEPPCPSEVITRTATLPSAGGTTRTITPDSVSRTREGTTDRLRKRLAGDLDNIVLMAMRKEPTRRYQSAEQLAADIQRHLSHEPVVARPASFGYRFSKFVRKNRGPVAAAAAFLLLITASAATLTVLLGRAVAAERESNLLRDRAEAQRKLAERRRADSDRMTEFLDRTLFGVRPSIAMGRDTAMLKDMMDAAARRIADGELADLPNAELRLRRTIGRTYREIADFDAAAAVLQPATQPAHVGTEHDHDAVGALHEYGLLLYARGDFGQAEATLRDALTRLQQSYAGDHEDVATCLNCLGQCLIHLRRFPEAAAILEGALAMYQRLDPDHVEAARCLGGLGGIALTLNGPQAALPRFEQALAIWRQHYHGDHPDLAEGSTNVAMCLERLGRSQEALPQLTAVLDMRRRLHTGDHPDVALSLNNVGCSLQSLGQCADALAYYEEALAMRRKLYAGDHPSIALSLNNIGSCLRCLGRVEEALEVLRAAAEMSKRLPEFHAADRLVWQNNLGFLLLSSKRLDEALLCFREAVGLAHDVLPPDDLDIAAAKLGLGAALVERADFQEAEALLTELVVTATHSPRIPEDLKKQVYTAMTKLYASWHAAEPDKGYDLKAAEWAKLEEMQATQAPATAGRLRHAALEGEAATAQPASGDKTTGQQDNGGGELGSESGEAVAQDRPTTRPATTP